MKKILTIVSLILCLALTMGLFVACSKDEGKSILVVSRESGSGTRDAFDSLIKNSAGATLAKKADGTAHDSIVKSADIQNSTGNVMTKVASVKDSIGYISLGSLNDTVKAITVDGVVASADNVLSGKYKLQRPFVIATKKDQALTEATQDFIKYLTSKQAQEIVKQQKYVEQASNEEYVAPNKSLTGTVIIKGSTSIDPLMDNLIKDYQSYGGSKVTSVNFTKDAQGSSHGISEVKKDTTGNVIGMSSSIIKSADSALLNHFNLALDAVAIIVHNENAIKNISVSELYYIYTGVINKFGQLL